MKKLTPNYKILFEDIINKKFPEKKKECLPILKKQKLSVVDIIKLNEKIFESHTKTIGPNQKFRSYGKSDILQILDYQKKHKLNNIQLAKYFKLSRNTVAKWKKIFQM
ncbi:helix-turn-helix domain-containing protein [Chryseobacterium sp.]|uniref:helix-turn-helix domain-containing protein n=1 Tax=Chryseobacterium sp. TaxID=1871047 RepID=UPI00334283C6